jgi:hypothetical protein
LKLLAAGPSAAPGNIVRFVQGLTRGRQPMIEPEALAAETEAYQALLEGHRANPDNEDLYRDMLKARGAMEIAWLENVAGERSA